MLINEQTAISTSSILLLPYTAAHVLTYHEWMKDSEIQVLTASEPLSLDSEYEMQRSWRTDADKLTFIICLPLDSSSLSSTPTTTTSSSRIPNSTNTILKAQTHDDASRMIGDVNLFLTQPDTTEHEEAGICTGEIELMIAVSPHRRKGYGRNAVLAFILYICRHVSEILDEFSRGEEVEGEGKEKKRWKGLQLRVKIGEENVKSLRLFEGLGFGKIKEEVSYFGEWELWFDGVLSVGEEGDGREKVEELGRKFGVEDWSELGYDEDVNSSE